MFNGGIILLRNNKPGEQEEIIEPVAGTLCSHVTRGGSRNIVGGGGGPCLLCTCIWDCRTSGRQAV